MENGDSFSIVGNKYSITVRLTTINTFEEKP